MMNPPCFVSCFQVKWGLIRNRGTDSISLREMSALSGNSQGRSGCAAKKPWIDRAAGLKRLKHFALLLVILVSHHQPPSLPTRVQKETLFFLAVFMAVLFKLYNPEPSIHAGFKQLLDSLHR